MEVPLTVGERCHLGLLQIEELRKAEAEESKGDRTCGSSGADRIVCWLEVGAVREARHQVERQGRKQQT